MSHRGVLLGFWAAVIACATFFAPALVEAAPAKANAKAVTTQPVAQGAKAKKNAPRDTRRGNKAKRAHAGKHGKKQPAAGQHKAYGAKVAHKPHAKKKKKQKPGKKKHKATARNTHAPMKAKAKPKPVKPVKSVAKPKITKPTPVD
jgi:hypothetical protein